jgi:hypothetical protein
VRGALTIFFFSPYILFYIYIYEQHNTEGDEVFYKKYLYHKKYRY